LSVRSGNSGYPHLGDTVAAILQKACELSSSITKKNLLSLVAKEQVKIIFDFNEKELAARDYPLSIIFNVDETVLTVVKRNNQKSSHSEANVGLAL
jgi:hypothetical protein